MVSYTHHNLLENLNQFIDKLLKTFNSVYKNKKPIVIAYELILAKINIWYDSLEYLE